MGQEASAAVPAWKPERRHTEPHDGLRSGAAGVLRRIFPGGQKACASKAEPRPAATVQPFPEGLGPCKAVSTSFQAGDVIQVEYLDTSCGGYAFFPKEFFRRSRSFASLASRIEQARCWTRNADGGEAIAARVSPSHSLGPCRALRRGSASGSAAAGGGGARSAASLAAGLPEGEEVRFVWVYPAQLDWRRIFPDATENVDISRSDLSFFTVGGYVYFRSVGKPRKPSESRISGNSSSAVLSEIQILGANAIVYDPGGSLQFAAPRFLEPVCVNRLLSQRRFQAVTAQKWVSQGARHFCWVRPGEALSDAEGKDRPLTHFGGFVFLFRDPEAPSSSSGEDLFFEVASVPSFLTESAPSVPVSALPYGTAQVPLVSRERQREKFIQFVKTGHWLLVQHLLMENPRLAVERDERGESVLHHGARHCFHDRRFLGMLKESGVPYDARNAEGKTAEDIGDRVFRKAAREAFGLSPDLFEDPERWFDYWDKNSNGILECSELAEALTATYSADEVGRKWIRSFANTHHKHGVSKARFLANDGLLHELQFSTTFAELRRQRTPPLFRGGLTPLRDDDCAQLVRLEERFAMLRTQNGWTPGSRAPTGAHRLQMPMPFAGGCADVVARMRNARQMLSFSLAQTSSADGKAWQRGFRVNFAGQDGVDDGGLTKAWGQELAFALWGNDDYFEVRGSGWYFFKPDAVSMLQLDGQPIASVDLYRWVGRFLAYLLYQHCLVDCFLCPWAFRVLHRVAKSRQYLGERRVFAEWPETEDGDDRLLEDMSSLDAGLASSLWRVHHEMSDSELQWLDFTCCGTELVPGGANLNVTKSNRTQYVRLCCLTQLVQRARQGLQAFADGFLEVIPAERLSDVLEGGVQHLLLGAASLSDLELSELERLVVPGGLVPVKLRDHPRVREVAKWFFNAARSGNSAFRSRLLEFWIGTSRIPLTGVQAIQPRPKLQVMVQPDGKGGVKRISSWPQERLPEGHTCGNELWIPLQDTSEQTVERLRLAVENFEAGFALK